MKKLVVLSGAGISAESGLSTFRDSGGLWEGHDIMEVASIEGWKRNPALVQDFYNKRRKQALSAKPNTAHLILAGLEKTFQLTIITQNVDDLHEKAGSGNVIHLHGELGKSQSSVDAKLVYPIKDWEIREGELCEKGSQLRPHIVWFGEQVPNMVPASKAVSQADFIIVVGTSLQVYPAAGLLYEVRDGVPIFLIDPSEPEFRSDKNITYVPEKATVGMKIVEQLLLAEI